jgi:hypothetical protein
LTARNEFGWVGSASWEECASLMAVTWQPPGWTCSGRHQHSRDRGMIQHPSQTQSSPQTRTWVSDTLCVHCPLLSSHRLALAIIILPNCPPSPRSSTRAAPGGFPKLRSIRRPYPSLGGSQPLAGSRGADPRIRPPILATRGRQIRSMTRSPISSASSSPQRHYPQANIGAHDRTAL